MGIDDEPQPPFERRRHRIIWWQLHHPWAGVATWAGTARRRESGRGGGRRRRHDDDDGGGGQIVLYDISFNLEKERVEIGHQVSIGRRKKSSTETRFERGKIAAISKVYRLIIIKNALERWVMPF